MEAHDAGRLAAARHQHHRSPLLGQFGFLVSMSVPAAIAIVGVVALGFDEIDWAGAAVWGVVATAVFTLVSLIGAAMGMTRMDLLDLLGSVLVRPGSSASRALGAVIHHLNGALLAIAWAYGVALVDLPQTGDRSGLGCGAHGAGALDAERHRVGAPGHPPWRAGGSRARRDAPWRVTPLGSLMGHLLYGLVLGLTYDAWPLS